MDSTMDPNDIAKHPPNMEPGHTEVVDMLLTSNISQELNDIRRAWLQTAPFE